MDAIKIHQVFSSSCLSALRPSAVNVLISVLLLIGLVTPCLAQTSGADHAEQKRKLIEQKIRLIDMLVNSPAGRKAAAGQDADSAMLLEKGQQSLEAARRAFADSRLDEATRLLDDALKSASSSSRKMSANGGGLSESAQRKRLSDLTEQVATYRASVVDLTRDNKVAVEARQLLSRIDALSRF